MLILNLGGPVASTGCLLLAFVKFLSWKSYVWIIFFVIHHYLVRYPQYLFRKNAK
ncbi:hypothetical protein ND16A_0210, partial [Thalassotalea sp. ND16A]